MKINKIYRTLVGIAVFVLCVLSCKDDFLEVGATGSLAEVQMTSYDGIDGVLIGAYSALNGVFGGRFEAPNHWVTGSITGGEANKGTDPGDASSLNSFQRYEYDPTASGGWSLNSFWRGRFEGVSRSNKVLSLIAMSESLNASDAVKLSAEARLLRGHFYFDLKKHFNSVPYIDENIEDSEISKVPNTPDIWDKIEADFKYAFDNLPETQSQAGRVNKWAAAAYMGKAKLYQGKWSEAKQWLDNVINNGVTTNGLKLALIDDYAEIYNAENDNHAEAIFDVESSNNTGSTQNANYYDDLNYPYNTGVDGPGNCCGFFQPSFELANSFRTKEGLPLLDGSYNATENELVTDFLIDSNDDSFAPDSNPLDPRVDHSIGRRGIPYLDWIAHPGKKWIRKQDYAGPYSPKKYVYYKSQEGSFTDASSWTRGYAIMNYTIIRFADVLLMAAEAEVELGNLNAAMDLVNQVRTRAAQSAHWVKDPDGSNAANYVINGYTNFPDADYATKAVRMERKLELSGEGHRFFDLVRWGIASDELNTYLEYESKFLGTKFGGAKFTAGKNEYYPIPQTQIDIQGKEVLKQNPGY